MRRVAYQLGLIAVLFTALGICACSSSNDPLEEVGWRWAINDPVVINDSGEESDDHNIDPTSTGAGSMTVILESNANVDTDVWIHTFSAQITTSDIAAPAISGGTWEVDRWLPANGGTLTLEYVFFTGAEKSDYIDELGGTLPDGFSADYHINFSVQGSFSRDNEDNDVTINDDTWFTVIGPTPTPTPTP